MKIFAFSTVFACIALLTVPVMAQGKQQGKGPQATPVVVFAATISKFVDRVEAIGNLRANETIVVASTVTETVTAINFEDGQRIKKGDIMVEMTSAEEKALIDQQRATVNETSKQLQRAKELAQSGAASTSQVEERQREFSSAKAGMAALQSRMEDHIIVAPFDGIVGLRNVSIGALIQPGTKITTLDDDTIMKLDFPVPSVFLPALHPGLDIVAKATGFDESFKGTISAIDSQVSEETRSVIVRAQIPNPDGKLKPGLLMSVELLKNPRESVTIPETAIVPEGRKTFVFVVNDKASPIVAEKREVVIGTRRPGEVEVIQHLTEGEKVVVMGTMNVRDAQPVVISAEQAKGETLQDVLKKAKAKAAAETSKEK